jgi:hypothetical protein
MNIGICYKGVFNINYIKQNGVDKNLLNTVEDTINNHKSMIYSDLLAANANIDTFISSYNIDESLNKLLITGYDVKNFVLLNKNEINTNTWVAQLNHIKNLIFMIRNEEIKKNIQYDYLIFTRFDVEFHKNYNILNLKSDKFNITVEHPSGNCDDNLWIFPRNYLDIFENSVNSLIVEGKITHELNHKILFWGGDINYIDELIESYTGHTVFSLIR